MSSHIGPQPPAGYTQASGIEWICHKRILDLVASSRSVAVRSKEDGSIHGGDEWEDKKGFEAKHELVGASPTLRRCPFQSCLFSLISLFCLSLSFFSHWRQVKMNKDWWQSTTKTNTCWWHPRNSPTIHAIDLLCLQVSTCIKPGPRQSSLFFAFSSAPPLWISRLDNPPLPLYF